jgi:hypothetical protein
VKLLLDRGAQIDVADKVSHAVCMCLIFYRIVVVDDMTESTRAHTSSDLDSINYRLYAASDKMHWRVNTSIGYCSASVFVILNKSFHILTH